MTWSARWLGCAAIALAALFGVTEPLGQPAAPGAFGHGCHRLPGAPAGRRWPGGGGRGAARRPVWACLQWFPSWSWPGPPCFLLVLEQRLVRASERWQQELAVDLLVVSEQLAMLLNAGYDWARPWLA